MPRPTCASLAADVRALTQQLNTEIALRGQLARKVDLLLAAGAKPQSTSDARRAAVLRLHTRYPDARYFTLEDVEAEVLRAVN